MWFVNKTSAHKPINHNPTSPYSSHSYLLSLQSLQSFWASTVKFFTFLLHPTLLRHFLEIIRWIFHRTALHIPSPSLSSSSSTKSLMFLFTVTASAVTFKPLMNQWTSSAQDMSGSRTSSGGSTPSWLNRVRGRPLPVKFSGALSYAYFSIELGVSVKLYVCICM